MCYSQNMDSNLSLSEELKVKGTKLFKAMASLYHSWIPCRDRLGAAGHSSSISARAGASQLCQAVTMLGLTLCSQVSRNNNNNRKVQKVVI